MCCVMKKNNLSSGHALLPFLWFNNSKFHKQGFFISLCKYDFADHFYFSKDGKSHRFLSKSLQIVIGLCKTLKPL